MEAGRPTFHRFWPWGGGRAGKHGAGGTPHKAILRFHNAGAKTYTSLDEEMAPRAAKLASMGD